nr:DUF3368 domain-containing protein [Bacteroidota bacterium]
MPKIIVSDTSCLIIFEKLNRINLLESLYGEITITQIVADEYKGRREAKQLNINYTGTVGILVAAKEKGFIKTVFEILDEIVRTNFRISEKLVEEVKRRCGES